MAEGTGRTLQRKTAAQLADGDHVFVRRYKLRSRSKRPKNCVEKYTYSHHGIWDDQNKRVIGFGEPRKASSQEAPQEARYTQLETAAKKVREAAIATASWVTSRFNSSITKQSPKSFYCRDTDGLIFVYQYCGETQDGRGDDSTLAEDVGSEDGLSPDYARNDSFAAEIARWFLKEQPKAFGSYHLKGCNCEHFATFCKTYAGTIKDLNDTCAKMSKKGIVPMAVWQVRSKTRSLQAERFIAGKTGILTRKGVVEQPVSEVVQDVDDDPEIEDWDDDDDDEEEDDEV